MQKTLGGDRLGSGKRMKVELHNYGRSTHNLSRAWRSSMSPGTLVPFLVEPALNGDTFDIDIAGLVRTLPTVAPLFGSFKLQADVFVAPLRLYNRQLHNNKLGIGLEMHKVMFPHMKITANNNQLNRNNPNATQINPSSLLAYLGIRGLGGLRNPSPTIFSNYNGETIERYFDAQPFLAYWDIFKNYYANKQEAKAFVMSGGSKYQNQPVLLWGVQKGSDIPKLKERDGWIPMDVTNPSWANSQWTLLTIKSAGHNVNWTDNVTFKIESGGLTPPITQSATTTYYTLTELINNNVVVGASWDDTNYTIQFAASSPFNTAGSRVYIKGNTDEISTLMKPVMEIFPLKNIDDMREHILGFSNNTRLIIDENSPPPYYVPFYNQNSAQNERLINNSVVEMCGLALKTYQSDRFNNFLSSESITGANGIAELTKIDTSDGLKLDALNLAQKVYNVLTRIAVSGGSYHDWQEAVYGEIVHPIPETPWFAGGTSQEITFTEVTSTMEGDEYNPLGTLAGKGYSQNNSKRIHINIKEPSYIIGIVSITPRIDYSQGNKWFTKLSTMDDLHKPALDAIGFQKLITDEMAAFDVGVHYQTFAPEFKSAGFQPSWIHYMTSQNECYGNFAEPLKEMYMTLTRFYEMDDTNTIGDLTTYIDPEKFNINFARTDLGAQNFWVQLGIDVIARRKMSAKQIPNL